MLRDSPAAAYVVMAYPSTILAICICIGLLSVVHLSVLFVALKIWSQINSGDCEDGASGNLLKLFLWYKHSVTFKIMLAW